MDYILDGLSQAFQLIRSSDQDLSSAVWISLRTSMVAICCASLLGVPVGIAIATRAFPGREHVVTMIRTLMALPTVVVGLLVYSLLSRQGPLGPLGLLYTPTAMVCGQFVLATPIIMALTHSAVHTLDPRVRQTAMSLGASRLQTMLTVISEAKVAIMGAVVAGFGRVIAEVGAAMMLGGNIRGYTRTMTTTIALETSKGEFGLGLALGIILLIVALSVNILLHSLTRGET